ncbi:copper resistance CopC family protein [Curtobacterium sp. RRHDQ10]|uniref:copper resistance CopC family protein n=1 Tax=Curtobacterium phyllosphaerae TaxID=3413379 RepID=UPI003BF2DC29
MRLRDARDASVGSRASSPSGRLRDRCRPLAWRRGAAAAVVAALAGGAVLGLAAPASAHNYMIASTPAVDGTLTALPKSFEITTNDRLLDIDSATNPGFAFRIKGPDGKYFENGCVAVDGPSMTTTAALGASGRYTAEWQIVSADGHTVSDQYAFTWQAPASFVPSKGATTPPTCATADTDGGAGSGAATTPAESSGASASSTTSGSDGVLGDALWIGGGGIVVIALVVVVLLLLRRPAGEALDDDPDDADGR